MNRDENKNVTIYEVVVNHEEQYSVWPEYKGDPPLGWKKAGKSGQKDECLAYVEEVWTDMRPLSLRKEMEEIERRRPEREKEEARRGEEAKKKPKDPGYDLVRFLSEGNHPVEAGLRPEKTIKSFKEAIDHGYVHIKFTDTSGGTELGVRLDIGACDFGEADLENEKGRVHIEGNLKLNYVKVRCIANLELETLAGQGHLEPLSE